MNKKITELTEVFNQLVENENTQKIIDLISSDLQRGIIFSGVGKNWYISEKLCKTFLSMSIKSQSLDPVHALHGDIGMIENQFIIFTSKSGNTKELKTLIDYLSLIRKNGIISPIFIGVFLNAKADLYNAMDYCITPTTKVSQIDEFDSANLVPSLSINIIQMFLDYVGSQVFDKNPQLKARYKWNHPAGAIGSSLGMEKLLD
jgi:arabinose-5-phosphate isomerase